MKVEGCYANLLDNCTGKLSREHVISESLIGDVMEVHFDDGHVEFIKKEDYVVYILCQGHNNYFSSLESQKRHLQTWWAEDASLYKQIRENTNLSDLNLPNKYTIKGEYFEKWLLKSAINDYYFRHNQMPKINIDYAPIKTKSKTKNHKNSFSIKLAFQIATL